MKKWLAFLIAVVLLCTGGCQSISCGDAPQVNEQTHTEFSGVEVRVAKIHRDDGNTRLDIIWSNDTSCQVTYGEPYTIERLEGDQWVSCAKQTVNVFVTVGYMLKAGEEVTKTYAISDLFDVTVPGTYRFKTSCSVYAGGESSQPCTLWTEFSVGEWEDYKETEKPVDFEAQYIRTDIYQGDAEFPNVEIIRSHEELSSYYKGYKDSYDEAYFETGYLMFIHIGEGSGSIRHKVTKTAVDADGRLSVFIQRIVPEEGTCDMAQWHIILELSKETEVASEHDVRVYLDNTLAWDGERVTPPKPEAAFQKPPAGTLTTPNGEIPLALGGYSWTHQMANGAMEAVIADQASRPIESQHLKSVVIDEQYAETVYAYVPETGKYQATNALGYFVKLSWETAPASISYTCWSDVIWQDGSTPEETVASCEDSAFYAKPGNYIYEITTTWEDTGVGYHGTANYYVYITTTESVSQ